MDDIQLDRQPVKPQLPRDIKVIRVGDLIIVMRWVGIGWRQVPDEEKKEILRDFVIDA